MISVLNRISIFFTLHLFTFGVPALLFFYPLQANASDSHEACDICGDGDIDTGEECDDANLIDNDNCSNACTINEIPIPICGNGIKEDREACDDGNLIDDDTCADNCTLNSNEEPVCGNGIIDGSDECDDGNSVDNDECANDCTIVKSEPLCGNGILEENELCDDGNSIDTDQCDNNCVLNEIEPVCGNNLIEGDEECDDGNLNNDDTCLNDCTLTDETCPTAEEIPDCDPDHKSLVCHVPPGNPDNTHTICIDNNAVQTHLDHGDAFGACANECIVELDDQDTTDNATSSSDNGSASVATPSPATGGCSLSQTGHEQIQLIDVVSFGLFFTILIGARKQICRKKSLCY